MLKKLTRDKEENLYEMEERKANFGIPCFGSCVFKCSSWPSPESAAEPTGQVCFVFEY